MELVVMRHGRIPANEARLYAGTLDEPLSELGRADCRAAGVCPDVRRVYVSPRLRCRQTASICFPRAEQVVVPELAEMDFGDFEGRSGEEMYGADAAYTAWVDGGCRGRCPHGESRDGFTARVAAGLGRLLIAACGRGESRVIVVAHGGTVMAALSSLAQVSDTKGPDSYYDWHVGNCGGYRARVRFDGGKAPVLGDCARFEDLGFLC